MPRDRIESGTVMHSLGYPLRHDEFGGGFLYAMPEGGCRWDSSWGSTTRTRSSTRTLRSISSRGIRSWHGSSTAARWCGTAPKRCPRRMEHRSTALHRRRVDRGRCWWIPQLDAPEGYSPGDANRNARCRDCVRSGPIERYIGRRIGLIKGEARWERSQGGALSGSKRPPGLWIWSACRPHVRWLESADRRPVAEAFARCSWSCAHADPEVVLRRRHVRRHIGKQSRIAFAECSVSGRSPLTFDKVTNVHYSGTAHDETSHRICWCTPRCVNRSAVPSTDIPALRFCPANVYEIVHEPAGRGFRSMRRIACTARRATSWTRARSSRGSRPKAVRDHLNRQWDGVGTPREMELEV